MALINRKELADWFATTDFAKELLRHEHPYGQKEVKEMPEGHRTDHILVDDITWPAAPRGFIVSDPAPNFAEMTKTLAQELGYDLRDNAYVQPIYEALCELKELRGKLAALEKPALPKRSTLEWHERR